MKFLCRTVLVIFAGALAAAEASHMRITNGPYESEYVSLAVTGDYIGAAWMDGREGNQEIYFKLVDLANKNMSPARRLTNSANWDYRPQLAWNGQGFGLLWMHERKVKRDIYFARLDTQGNMVSGPLRLLNQQRIEKDTLLAWTGSGYGYVYGDYRPGNLEIFYQALTESGQKEGPEVQLTRTPGKTDISRMVFTGSDFALTFLDDSEGVRHAHFMLFDKSGNIKAQRRVSSVASHCTQPSIVKSGAGFGMAWCQSTGNSEQVFFAALDSSGNPLGEPRTVTSDSSNKTWAEIAPISGGFGLAFYAGDRLLRTLNFCTIDSAGKIIEAPRALTPARKAEAACPVIRMAESGRGLVIAWIDLGNNLNSEIFLTLMD